MTLNEYQKLAARTINHKLTRVEQRDHALHGLVGEIGEIHSMYQKAYQGHDFDFEQLRKEIGDVMWMVAELCTAHAWQLDAVCCLNIDKLKARYPEGFDPDKSMNRQEGDI